MIRENFSLKKLNTFGIEAKAKFFGEVTSVSQLQEILSLHRWRDAPKLILGEGSNILLTQDFQGLALKICIPGIEKVKENQDHVWLKVGAGENWHRFVLYCIEQGYGGVENLSLIPGTVGAAPLQNIGAYGVELTEVFDSLSAVRIKDSEQQVFHHGECRFGYRDSIFKSSIKNQYVITDVTLRLNKHPQFHIEYGALKQILNENDQTLTIKNISDAVIKIRSQKLPDPKIIGNAGSFFKNPIVSMNQFKLLQEHYPPIPHFPIDAASCKIPAAWLIEQCQWKGYRKGEVGVHQHHALVLVNYGKGMGKDIHQLAKDIQQSVWDKFAVEILPEVNII